MRDETIVQAKDEVKILDRISVSLGDTLRTGYDRIRANTPAVRPSGGDLELEAQLHNNSLRLLDALEEVGRRGYGRVALLQEINDAGEVVDKEFVASHKPMRASPKPRSSHGTVR